MEVSLKFLKLILLSLYLSGATFAQNILFNGSFEDFSECPKDLGQLELCLNWYIPNNSTPDIFKNCEVDTSLVNVPNNFCGYQEPFQGSAYAGLILFHGKDIYKNYREYIQGEFKEVLEDSARYRISFYVSWAECSKYFCDRIGFLFTNEKAIPLQERKIKKRKSSVRRNSVLNNVLPKSNGYVLLNFNELKNRDSWYKVEFVYKARGGEKFLTLGLFGDNATDEDYQQFFKNASSTGLPESYIYIDGISVEKINLAHY